MCPNATLSGGGGVLHFCETTGGPQAWPKTFVRGTCRDKIAALPNLFKLLGELRGNALWDLIKWFCSNSLVWTVVVWAFSRGHSASISFAIGLGVAAALTVAIFLRPALVQLEPLQDHILQRFDGRGFSSLAGNVALIAVFKNEPLWWRMSVPEQDKIVAQIDFLTSDRGHRLLQRSHAGSWVDSTDWFVQFGSGEVRKLIIAFQDRRGFFVPEMPLREISPESVLRDVVDAHQCGVLLSNRPLDDGRIQIVRVALAGTHVKQDAFYRICLDRHNPWIESVKLKRRRWLKS